MNCIVIDDEPLARKGMQLLIADITDLSLLGSFASIIEADNFLQSTATDIIFLDLQMPEIHGFDYLKIHNSNSLIVITTAYPQYALESYDYNVFDYITKPIRKERLLKTVQKCRTHFSIVKNNLVMNNPEYFFIRVNKKFIRININDILYISGEKDYSKIVCVSNNYLVPFNLKSIEKKIEVPCLHRISKSYIVNEQHIRSFDSEFVEIGETIIPIGEAYSHEFVEYFVGKRIIKKQ
ncbi:MAG TPA: LytTR family DNA-binding domain-containing protein [Candidatus Kapabacteria bacterium]|jgi:two-component system LytT family response regulator|nr:response regulator transcription factor [Ignavibacteria bacterium]HRE57205.1 LytTR family DNA-binding domain-containing protein [Candidatus Kapabacteria bacterium]HRK60246.1 LytTR family DNA-binding domain-containing protein [Candidatus Kapabacteria bacterium]